MNTIILTIVFMFQSVLYTIAQETPNMRECWEQGSRDSMKYQAQGSRMLSIQCTAKEFQ